MRVRERTTSEQDLQEIEAYQLTGPLTMAVKEVAGGSECARGERGDWLIIYLDGEMDIVPLEKFSGPFEPV